MKTLQDDRWKWFFEPLAPAMRRRLEVTLAVVLTGASVVALSTMIQADPKKLAPTVRILQPRSAGELRMEASLRPEPPAAPKVPIEFSNAVANADLATLERLYTPGMPLDGMLSLAAEQGHENVARWLLDHSADVHEAEDTLDAPVLLADAHPNVVSLLLQRGVAEASLENAARAGALTTVLRLLAQQAAVNSPGASPLADAIGSTRATAENKLIIVEKLLAAGADPNHDVGNNPLTVAVGTCGEPPQEQAPTKDCLVIAKLLVARGARTKGDALIAALPLEDPRREEIFAILLAAPLERGATAMALAQIWSPSPPIIKSLVAKGVDWSWHDGEDDSALPLLTAVQRGDRDYVRALLDAGAPVDTRFKDGSSPLGEAIDGVTKGNASEYARIVELFIARGVDVNRRLPDGRTPLFAAAESGDLRIVNALLARGARVNDVVLDDTALDAAEQGSHTPVARVLHTHGGRRARKGS